MKHILTAYILVTDEYGAVIHTVKSGGEVPPSVMGRAKTVTAVVVKTSFDEHGDIVSAGILGGSQRELQRPPVTAVIKVY